MTAALAKDCRGTDRETGAYHETLRDGGQTQRAAIFQARLAKAQAIRDRLKGK